MSGQMNKFKEEQILIICPGSQTTMAQLGCGELTPPALRIPTRMFRDEETGEWRPYRTWKRKKQQKLLTATSNGAAGAEEDEWEYVEDPESSEGAVYPLEGGHIVNMPAFLAFLEHVHGLLTTTYHNTPIVLMTSSQWTRPDCEAIALYIFEKTRTPALCMINSALATQYGLKWPHMTVIDIGYEKVDVTCIFDSRIVNHMAVGYSGEPGDDRAISGGEVFTQRLRKLLKDKEFTYEMAEQLKKSNICEVLPYAPEFPQLMELPEDDATAAAPAAAATMTTDDSAAAGTVAASSSAAPPTDGAEEEDGALPVAEDGVLDVASIVTSGQTKEFLAKKDKERSERGRFGRRGKDKEAAEAAARPVRLPNSKRARMMFHFEELVEEEEAPEPTSNGHHGASRTNGTANVNGKSHDEEGDGSEDGSEDEEMEEDEEEEGEGEEDEAEGASKSEKPAAADPAADAEKPKEETTAPSTEVKAEEAPSAAPAAPEPDKAEPAEKSTEKPAEEKAPEVAESATEKPKEPEAPASSGTAAPAPAATTSEDKPASPKAAAEDATMEDAPAAKEETTDAAKPAETPAAEAPATSSEMILSGPPPPAAAPAETAVAVVEEPKGPRYKRLRRDFEIGIERFTFADRFEIDRIVTTIYRTVQGIEEMYMRPPCWENLVFVGNGCRLRGLRENILQTLTARHLISPSTATMFTSELPSNLGTPSGTGSQTPTGSFSTPPHQLPTSSSVNPLLQAATTASLTGVPGSVTGGPGSVAGGDGHSHHFHSQTPTTIKLATLPTYLGEWTKNGFEEAMFLGAQVAARLAFCVHNLDAAGQESQRQMSLTRVDYNELGPKGIRTHAMLG
ncbi:Actin-like protein arp9 [Sporothrix eucalyptigena]